MAPRSSWKGYLRLSLVSVPVQAFNAAESGGGDIHLNQLHSVCHNRIRYKKVCPVHGEVPNDEIVMGYEYGKGEYVIIDEDEVDKLRTEADKAINIDTFVPRDSIDPVYFNGRTYYLLPDGPMGLKPYAVLLKALDAEGRWAVGQAVFFGREQLVMLRPLDEVICLEMLHYAAQVRQPASFTSELSLPPVAKEELRLASKLIEASTRDKFDLAQYEDQYTTRLKELIDAKVAGKEIVAAPGAEESTPVINLMDALRQSVARAKQPQSRKKPAASTAPAASRAAHGLTPPGESGSQIPRRDGTRSNESFGSSTNSRAPRSKSGGGGPRRRRFFFFGSRGSSLSRLTVGSSSDPCMALVITQPTRPISRA